MAPISGPRFPRSSPILGINASGGSVPGNPDWKDYLLTVLSTYGENDLNNISLSNLPNVLEWQRSSMGAFSTRKLQTMLGSPMHSDVVLGTIWLQWLPPTLSTFLWCLKHHALPTDDQIRPCGISIASRCRCYIFP
ncbi:hypothetical protein QQ045_020440 [Rhodiola kirilowii]